LIGALRPFPFIVNIERCLLFPVIFVALLFSFYLFLVYWSACSKGFILSWVFLLTVVSSICKNSSVVLAFVAKNSFSFSLLWKFKISPSIREDSFAGQINLSWQLLSFRDWIMSLHDLLAFKVWVEKSAVFFWWGCLYMWPVFSLLQLSEFFLCFVCWVFW
jgi:hypothetical protein